MAKAKATKTVSAKDAAQLLSTLERRFAQFPARHEGLRWAQVAQRLEASPEKLWSLQQMEATGGEPDVIGGEGKGGVLRFVDCSAETPKGRVSLCFDRAALDARKEAKPRSCVEDVAAGMGVVLLDETQYRGLQQKGEFDLKTSSWIQTPHDVRALGGALFCDRRFGRVFTYHNGAQSYYAARGFRAALDV